MDVYLNYLAIAINNIQMLFDVDIILGGYVVAHIGDYLEDLYERVDAGNSFYESSREFLSECKYKIEASAAGAAIFFD